MNGMEFSGIEPDGTQSGNVTLAARQISWRVNASGEVSFSEAGKNQQQRFGELKLTQQDELALMNTLLNQSRPNAMPNGSQYYAASAVVSDDGHLFLSYNNELNNKDEYNGRGCAETAALGQAQRTLRRADVKLKAVYLMSGQAERLANGALKDKQKGHVACLCGECRDNLRSHTDGDTQFIMMPAGGQQIVRLNSHAASAAELEAGEGWLISHAQMYPVKEHVENTAEGIADVVRKGALFTMNTGARAPLINAKLPAFMSDGTGYVRVEKSVLQELLRAYQSVDMSVPALKMNGTLSNINRAMLQLVKRAYAEHAGHVPEGKNLKITAVMMKTDNGEFYPGVSVEGSGWLPVKPQLFASTIGQAGNPIGFTEVYMMTFDSNQLNQEMGLAGAKEGGVNVHQLATPNAASLGRLIKNLNGAENPTITVMPINDGQLGDAELERSSAHFVTLKANINALSTNTKEQRHVRYRRPKRSRPICDEQGRICQRAQRFAVGAHYVFTGQARYLPKII